jgi:hypothetical protein
MKNHNSLFERYYQENSKIPAETCECVKSVESNGILKMLRLIALKVSKPDPTHPALCAVC